jgi:hypothetical protein
MIAEIVGREEERESVICNYILYFLNLLYYTYIKYWFDCILARGTQLYQHVLESVVGFIPHSSLEICTPENQINKNALL